MGELINKQEFERIRKESNMMKWAENELKLAGYTEHGEDDPNTWMWHQVMESLAVFISHENSGGSAPFEIKMVSRLASWKPITKLRFTDDEWNNDTFGLNDSRQNKRCPSFFKDKDGSISWNNAVTRKVLYHYHSDAKEMEKLDRPTYWNFSLVAECKKVGDDFQLTGNVYHSVRLKKEDVENGFYVGDTTYVNTIDVEFLKDDWISIVEAEEPTLKEAKEKFDIKVTYIDELNGLPIQSIKKEHENLIIKRLKDDSE